MQIKSIMSSRLKTVPPETTMVQAAKIMKDMGIRHLPVVNQNNHLVGLLSDRDIKMATTYINVPGQAPEAHIYPHKKVEEYMVVNVYKVNQDDEIADVIREVLDKKVSCLIVEDDKKKHVGLVTTDDLLLHMLELLKSQKSFSLKKILGF